MALQVSFSELKAIFAEAKEIYLSSISWDAKFDLIFSDRIRGRVDVDWYAHDASYEEDVSAFMKAFYRYMGEEHE
jgi:hypothetical protein